MATNNRVNDATQGACFYRAAWNTVTVHVFDVRDDINDSVWDSVCDSATNAVMDRTREVSRGHRG